MKYHKVVCNPNVIICNPSVIICNPNVIPSNPTITNSLAVLNKLYYLYIIKAIIINIFIILIHFIKYYNFLFIHLFHYRNLSIQDSSYLRIKFFHRALSLWVKKSVLTFLTFLNYIRIKYLIL